MFSKTSKTKATSSDGGADASGRDLVLASSADPGRKPRAASFIAPDMVIEGAIRGDCELQMDGTVRGEIQISRLTVGETGLVEGSITAQVVEVRGRILGTISAPQIRLLSTAHVEGDLRHDQLCVESGAYFEGRSQKISAALTNAAADTTPPPDVLGTLPLPHRPLTAA